MIPINFTLNLNCFLPDKRLWSQSTEQSGTKIALFQQAVLKHAIKNITQTIQKQIVCISDNLAFSIQHLVEAMSRTGACKLLSRLTYPWLLVKSVVCFIIKFYYQNSTTNIIYLVYKYHHLSPGTQLSSPLRVWKGFNVSYNLENVKSFFAPITNAS